MLEHVVEKFISCGVTDTSATGLMYHCHWFLCYTVRHGKFSFELHSKRSFIQD